MTTLTSEEAVTFLESAVAILSQLDDLERKPSSAIPRDVMNCGEAEALLSALVALLASAHPHLVDDNDAIVDLATANFRARN